ncbi:unnamed protein product [Penicillium olsonii]|nr:unnamed protein product [Penicillium olsonii]CAG8135768.1 unnamed protein product [Penicillium olsonii]
MAPRGRGGKFSKPSRGGGKHFSRDLAGTDKEGNQMGMWREPQDQIESSGDEDSSDEDSSEESSEDESKPTESSTAAGTREERRAAAKAKKAAAMKKRNQGPAQPGDLPPSDSEESDDGLPANPNHTAKSRSQTQKPAAGSDSEPQSAPAAKKPAAKKDLSQLSRREREAVQAQQARERYQKLHAEGKTDEAKSDLARLAVIREQREAERQRKLAEKEEKDEQAKERAEIALERERKMRLAAAGKLSKKAGGKKK